MRFVRVESIWVRLAAPSFPMLLLYRLRVSCVTFLRVESAWVKLAAPSFPILFHPKCRLSCVRFVRIESAWATLAAPSFPILLLPRFRDSCVRFLRVESAWTTLAAPSFPMLFDYSWTSSTKSWGISVNAAARFLASWGPRFLSYASIFNFSTFFMSLNCWRSLLPLSCMIHSLLRFSFSTGMSANYSLDNCWCCYCCNFFVTTSSSSSWPSPVFPCTKQAIDFFRSNRKCASLSSMPYRVSLRFLF